MDTDDLVDAACREMVDRTRDRRRFRGEFENNLIEMGAGELIALQEMLQTIEELAEQGRIPEEVVREQRRKAEAISERTLVDELMRRVEEPIVEAVDDDLPEERLQDALRKIRSAREASDEILGRVTEVSREILDQVERADP